MIHPIAPGQKPDDYFSARGLRGSEWSAGPGTPFANHSHARTKHLFVLRGSINFNGMNLEAPSGIVIDADTEHHALAGDEGVDCVEAFE